MNALCYKTVFSKRLGALVAVGEYATSQSKGQGAGAASGAGSLGSVLRYVGVLSLGFASVSLAWSQTLPQGGRVSQGQVTISQSGQQMAITQSTTKAVVNWDSFDIGANAKVNVVQPSSQSVLLNRVLSDNPTQILGQLQANGQVVLVNPKGIVVGSDGSVSASAFTASTLNISDADFMAGNGRYTREGSTGEVVNKGRISVAPGGYVALLGARVSNEGQIIAPQGSVALGAAETVSVPIGRTGRIKLELSPSSINASVANQKGGVIVAEGGQVYMQAAALGQAVASALHSGHIDTSGAQAGAVHVLADGGQIKVDGSITANSSGQDDQGQLRTGGDIVIGRDLDTNALAAVGDVRGATLESRGGFVETSGQYLVTTGTRVLAKDWLLDPYNITIAASGALGTAYSSAYTPGADSVILASDIAANLNSGTSVSIQTGLAGSPGLSDGNIVVNAAIVKSGSSDASLTLTANNGITVNQRIGRAAVDTTSSGKLNVVMTANGDATSTSNSQGIALNNVIDANGGQVTLSGTSKNTSGVQLGPTYVYGVNNNSRSGVVFNGGSGITADNYQVTGTHTVAAGNSFGVSGVYLDGSVTFKATGNTDSNITGNSNAQGNFGPGVMVMDNATIRLDNQGTGVTTLKGSNTNTGGGNGVRIGAGTNSAVINAIGRVTLGQQSANLNAPIFVRGTINASQNSASQSGLSILGQTGLNTSAVQIWDTTINATGIDVVVDGITANAVGVYIQNAVNTTWTTKNLTVIGVANTTAGSSGTGVQVQRYSNVLTVNASGNIAVQGTVQGTGTGRGLYFAESGWGAQAPRMTAGGNITLRGNNRASASNGLEAVYIASGVQAIAGGNIVLQGETNNAAANAIHLYSPSTTFTSWNALSASSRFGNTTLQATGNVLIQSNQGSVWLNNQLSSTLNNGGTPLLTSDTKITGKNITFDNTGAGMTTGASNTVGSGSIDATTGAITAGSGRATGTHGINFGDNRAINATVNLNIMGASTSGDGVRSIARMEAGESLNLTGQTESAAHRAVTITNNGALNGILKVTDGKTINIHANTLTLGGAATAVDAGTTSTVNIKTLTSGNEIVISAADTPSTTLASQKLGIDQSELNRINAGHLVIGDTASTGKITVSGATTTAATTGNVTLQTGGNIVVGAALTVGDNPVTTGTVEASKNLTLNAADANSSVSQTAAIKATGLELRGTNATHTLTNTGNDVQTLAGNVKSISFKNSGALTVGSVHSSSGITAKDGVSVTTETGDLSLNEAINNSTSGHVVVGAGITRLAADTTNGDVKRPTTATISNTAADGKIFVYSGSAANTGALSGLNAGFNNLKVTGNADQNVDTNAAFESGSGISGSTAVAQVVFREKLNFADGTLTDASLTKTYGDASTANTGAAVTTLLGEAKEALKTAAGVNSTVTVGNGIKNIVVSKSAIVDTLTDTLTGGAFSTSDFLKANTDTYKFAGMSSTKYGVGTGIDVTVNVNPLALTGSIAQGNTTYGSTLVAGAVNLTNKVGSDVVSANGVTINTTGNTSTSGHLKASDTAYVGIQSISALTGDDAANYTYANVKGDYKVDKLPLTGSIAQGQTTYGSALVAGAVNLTNKVGSDVVSATGVTHSTTGLTSTSGHLKAGTHTALQSLSGLTGDDAANYTFADVKGDYVVDKLALTGSIAQGQTTYGSVLVAGAVSLTNKVGSDVVSANGVTINTTGNTSTSGHLKASDTAYVGIQSVSALAGADAANYTFADIKGDYVVDKLALTGSIAQGQTTYGSALVTGTVSLTNTVGSDVVSATGVTHSTTGLTSTSGHLKAGTHTAIQSLAGLTGDDAANYTFADVKGDYVVDKLALTGSIAQGQTTYGSALVAGAVTLTNTVGSDVVIATGVAFNTIGNTSTSGHLKASDTAYVGIQSVSALTGVDKDNYTFADIKGDYKVDKLAINLSGITAAPKTYDGNTQATVSTGAVVWDGRIAGDNLSLSSTGTFGDKNVGTDKVVTLTHTLGGTDLGNYTVTTPASTTADITPKALTLNAGPVRKTYDGGLSYNTSAADLTALSAQLVSGDTVTAASLAFTDKNAGTGNKSITFNSATLEDGNNGDNYTLTLVGNNTSNIDKAPITVALQGSVEKTYNGVNTATVNNANFATSGWVSGEGASITQTAGVYANQNVSANPGNGSVSANLQLSDYAAQANTDLNNYNLPTSASGAVGKINPATLNIKVNDTKMFVTQDANLAFDQGFSYTGLVNGESAANALTGGAPSAGARTYTGAQFPGVGSLSGVYGLSTVPTALNGNYSVSVTPGNLQVIPADKLLVTINSQSDGYGQRKAPQAGVAASGTVTAQYCLDQNNCNGAGLYTLNLNSTNGSVWKGTDNTGNTITLVTGLAGTPAYSSGGYLNAGNHTYSLASLNSTVANQFNGHQVNGGVLTITPMQVSLNASDVTKVYDGNNSLLSATLSPSGTLPGDALQAKLASGSFDGKNAGTQGFTLSGLALQGADQTNYVLGSAQLSGTGSITPKAITVSGLQAQDKVYDGSTQASVQTSGAVFNGIVAGDQLSVTATGQFDTRHVGTNKTVSLTSSFGGADLGNYSITGQASSTASITPAPLVVTASAARKTYDGNTTAPGVGTVGALAGAAAGDTVAFAGTQAFTNKNAGTGKAVTVTGVRLVDGSNTDVSGNYAITYVNSQNGTIDRANASIAAQDNSTVYNGAVQSQSGISYSGFVAGDDVQASGLASGRNAGSYASSLSASGADVGNYNITYSNAALHIAKRPASLSALGQTVVYNGLVQSLNGTQGSGFVAGDALSFGGLPSGRNVGQYSSAMTVSGADAANYDITLGNATLTITPKSASVTARPERVTYNGQTQQQSAAVLEGFVAGDDIQVSGLASGRNAGVYGSNVLASGQDAGNYSITYQQGALTIDKAPLRFVGTSAADKVYDANTQASVTAGTITGLVGNESLSLQTVSGQFDSAEPGSNKPVTVVYGLGDGRNGGLVANYDWSPVTVTASIRREAAPSQARPEATRPVGQYSRLSYIGFGGLTGIGAATGQLYYAVPNQDAQQCTPRKLEECICEQPQAGALEVCYPQRRDQVSHSGQALTSRH